MLKESNPDWGCQRISDMLVRGPALPASPTAVARVLKEAGYELEEVAHASAPGPGTSLRAGPVEPALAELRRLHAELELAQVQIRLARIPPGLIGGQPAAADDLASKKKRPTCSPAVPAAASQT